MRKLFEFLRRTWRDRQAPSWMGSVVVHVMLLVVFSLFLMPPPPRPPEADLQTRLAEIVEEPEIEQVVIEPLEIAEPETLEQVTPEVAAPAMSALSDVEAVEPEPLSTVDSPALNNLEAMLEGVNPAGLASLGKGGTLNSRGKGMKQKMLGSQGGTKQTEVAVASGLDWLVRHQARDGHWSLQHTQACRTAGQCTCSGDVRSDMAATALGLLPFLAANYTHKQGPHRQVVGRALQWMTRNQRSDGLLLGPGDQQPMYTHGLALIALAEAYALTDDASLRNPVRGAIGLLASSQNETGGWRYTPKSTDADTSVFGWQLMGIKSAQMGGLQIPNALLAGCRKYLDSAALGDHGGLFCYDPNPNRTDDDGNPIKPGPTPTMTSVGLLCEQYLGKDRTDPTIKEGIEYLLKRPPDAKSRNAYYWYYATQVIHNFQGPEWDRWNRTMRRIWVEQQNLDKKSCAFGSWNPLEPTVDAHGERGGRHMVTCIGLLTLEVYYRYLPLYKVGSEPGSSQTSK